MGRCKPLDSLNSILPYAAQLSGANLVSPFTLRCGRWLLLAFPRSLAITMEGSSIPTIKVLGALTHIWRPEIIDDCDTSCLFIRQEMFFSILSSPSLPTISSAAAKSLQSCLTLCDPIDGSPPGSAVPGILQERTLEWVAISFSNA